MKFYNFLLRVFYILKSLHDILYQLSLSIVNVGKCDNFILISLYIYIYIYIFMQFPLSISHCFYKNVLN